MSKLEAEMIVGGVEPGWVNFNIDYLLRNATTMKEGWDGLHDGVHDHSMLGWLHEKAENAEKSARVVREAVEELHPEWRAP